MTEAEAAERFALFSSVNRLKAIKALIEAGPAGLSAGALGDQIGLAPSALSPHLALLLRHGLVQVRGEGRLRIYRAEPRVISDLLATVTRHGCGLSL